MKKPDWIAAWPARFGALAAATLMASACTTVSNPRDGAIVEAAVPSADLVLTNGKVYTVDATNSVHEAIAIRDGLIIATGSEAEIAPLVGPETRRMDLHERMVLPGLIDGHMHPLAGGAMLTACSLDYEPLTIDQILQRITACLKEDSDAAPGDWLRVQAWFRQATQPAGADLTAEILDRLPTDRPVVVQASDFHTMAGNSAAMAAAGITGDTPNPSDGEIVRDENGEATGIFLDGAMWQVIEAAPTPSEEAQRQINLANARAAVQAVNSQGVTTLLNASARVADMEAWADLHEEGGLTARSVFAVKLSPDEAAQPDQAAAHITDLAARYRLAGSAQAPGLVIDRAKLFVDGVVQAPAQTGAMVAPYFQNSGSHDHPQWAPGDKTGSLYFDEAELTRILDALVSRGLSAHMHTTGDKAIKVTLNAIETVRRSHDAPSFRPGLAHDEVIDPKDYPRFAQLDAIPVLSLQWGKPAPDTVDALVPQMGPERAPFVETAGKFHAAGARIAFGSDWPIEKLDEWLAMQIAVTRENPDPTERRYDGHLGDDPGLDIATAIRAFTINAAYSLNMEDRVGSLEPGKYADLIVIDRDLTAIPSDQIADTRVLLTLVGGREVYRSEDLSD
ncbi:amidohydrolase [Altericroceibacterium endophyticum]|uniref:Amidohydrolase family protein n=1 Tax=Altericroceibacterium endophyticum TaxID=1808508 RepID=A0A6I4T554_9SPHN|nr:amidohydrolase [Altericroceibacterium endophyticum]MXO65281.1 amidohydrolase family protein [Altericroceibacterium endophyticum]